MTDRVSERIWRAGRAAYESRDAAYAHAVGCVAWQSLRQKQRDIEYDAMVAAFKAVAIDAVDTRVAYLEAKNTIIEAELRMVRADRDHQVQRADGLAQGLAYQESLVPKEELAEKDRRIAELDAAYVRLRKMIPGAMPAPPHRSAEEAWAHTEACLKRMVDRIAELEAALFTMDDALALKRAERLEAALKPFAEYAERVKENMPGWYHEGFTFFHGGRGLYDVPMAWFIAALKAYRGEPAPPSEDKT